MRSLRLLLCTVISGLSLLILPVCAQIELADSHGKYKFKQPPQRVVVLNWALAEQLLELGITPIAMADIQGYRQHASRPIVPSSVIDVGARLNPDIERIKQLNPDIILIAYSQRPLIRSLSHISKVLYFKNFGTRYNNQERAKAHFLKLAKLFGKSDLANTKLEQQTRRLSQLRESLRLHFSERPLPILQILVPDTAKNEFWVFGHNSMPYYAAKALGLDVFSLDGNDQFGTSKLSIEQVNQFVVTNEAPVCQLYLMSYASSADDLPNAVPCAVIMPYQNAFGGFQSIVYLAEAIHSALLQN